MKIVSVTQALSPFNDFSAVPPAVLEEAKIRGTMAHNLFASYVLGLWIPSVPENCIGYFDSFNRWFDGTVEEVIAVEKRIVHPVHHFDGQLDLLCRIKGDAGLMLLDHKTPMALYKSWRVQCAAYKKLADLEYPSITRTGSLRLSRDGKRAKLEEYSGTIERDFALFLNCLSAYQYFYKEK
jgi:hypothetical protein